MADFRPVAVAEATLKERRPVDGQGEPSVIALVENLDIVVGVIADPPQMEGRTLVVGFAAKTGDAEGDALAHGKAKA